MHLPNCRMGFGCLSIRQQCAAFFVVVLTNVAFAMTTTEEPSISTTTSSASPHKTSSSQGLDMKTVITLSVTFPAGIVVGIVWCWCMSKVCGTDQRPPKARLNHPASLKHVQRVHRTDSFDA